MLNDISRVNISCTCSTYMLELDIYDIKVIMEDDKWFEKHMLMV